MVTEKQVQHTAGTWIADDDGVRVGKIRVASIHTSNRLPYEERLANAEVIARAVNSHDALLAVAARVAQHFEDTDSPLGIAARAAIVKARGES